MLKILFIGDIVSRLGRQAIKDLVPELVKNEEIDLVFANCENATNGRGISLNHYQELTDYGVFGFSAGEHIYRVGSIEKTIDNLQIAVPLNFYKNLPGKRFLEVDTGKKGKFYLVSLVGNLNIDTHVQNPFHAIDIFLEDIQSKNVIVDFHAEFTSEKYAMKEYLDGRVLAVLGTHTHVQTNDEQITQKGTAFITDLGMSGSTQSVIGVEPSIIINRLSKGIKAQFEWVKSGPYALNGVIISIDMDKQIAKNIVKVNLKGS